MVKIDKDVKKRWFVFATINVLILLMLYGTLMIGFAFFSMDSQKSNTKAAMTEYYNQLNNCTFDELQNAIFNDSESLVTNIENPNMSFGIYSRRGDGSFSFISNNKFLAKNSPQIGGKVDAVNQESIGGYTYLTYTAVMSDKDGSYIKVFAPADIMLRSKEYITKYSPLFLIGFLVVCIVMSFVWGYIEIKPIMANYLKQKNFINDMSHQIRTPLAIIKGNLENVLATADKSNQDVDDMLETSLKEVDYMTEMSSGLLSIVRAENKNIKNQSIMSDVISEAVDMYSDAIAISNKAIVACVDYCDMAVDKDKVKQLATILLENALKYTHDGDRINVKLKNTKDGCVFSVSDTGIGVKSDELDKIFERFYRGENVSEIQGTGLGLSIAKSIVESMNGTIKAFNNAPSGLEIVVAIKRA